MDSVVIRAAKENEWEDAMSLAWCTFQKYEAPTYSKRGVQSFLEFISDETLYKMFQKGNYKLFLALYQGKIIGMITLRNENFISLLFVDEKYHKQDVGRRLVYYVAMYIREYNQKDCCLVNAAPYAVGFYKKVGFEALGGEEENDGIRYTPMRLPLQ